MCSEESKEKKDEEACYTPEDFQGMFEMMNKCFTGEKNFDCSTITKAMKNQTCCSPTIEQATTYSDRAKKNICRSRERPITKGE